MFYPSQINADLHIKFVPAATIACCHKLILSTARAWSPKPKDRSKSWLINSSLKASAYFSAPAAKSSVN
jgi:hypothetical protein